MMTWLDEPMTDEPLDERRIMRQEERKCKGSKPITPIKNALAPPLHFLAPFVWFCPLLDPFVWPLKIEDASNRIQNGIRSPRLENWRRRSREEVY